MCSGFCYFALLLNVIKWDFVPFQRKFDPNATFFPHKIAYGKWNKIVQDFLKVYNTTGTL